MLSEIPFIRREFFGNGFELPPLIPPGSNLLALFHPSYMTTSSRSVPSPSPVSLVIRDYKASESARPRADGVFAMPRRPHLSCSIKPSLPSAPVSLDELLCCFPPGRRRARSVSRPQGSQYSIFIVNKSPASLASGYFMRRRHEGKQGNM